MITSHILWNTIHQLAGLLALHSSDLFLNYTHTQNTYPQYTA